MNKTFMTVIAVLLMVFGILRITKGDYGFAIFNFGIAGGIFAMIWGGGYGK